MTKTYLAPPEPGSNTPTWRQMKQACHDEFTAWSDKCEREAHRDPLRFHAIVAPRLLAEIDTAPEIKSDDDQAAILARRLAGWKREFLARWLDCPMQEFAHVWYERREQPFKQARREFADDPPPEITEADVRAARHARRKRQSDLAAQVLAEKDRQKHLREIHEGNV
jgi:hypothetical protein